MSDGADAVLVVGSSVSTFSAFKLVRDARGRPDDPHPRRDARRRARGNQGGAPAGQTLPLVVERARAGDVRMLNRP